MSPRPSLPRDLLYPNNLQAIMRIGELAAELVDLGERPNWILRRKEKATLLDESVVRRQMSVDFAIPKSVPALGEVGGRPVYYAPLFFLDKGLDEPFRPETLASPEPLFANFDLRNERGNALSLPSRSWNGLVTTEMLRAIIERRMRQFGSFDPAARPGISAIARELCVSDQRSAELRLETMRAAAEDPQDVRTEPDGDKKARIQRAILDVELNDEVLARTLEVCACSSVAMVPLIGEDCRHGIVKLSFDQQVAHVSSRSQPWQTPLATVGWSGYEFWVYTPYIAAASYHFEFQAPDGLEIYDAGLVRVDGPPETFAGGLPPEDAAVDRNSGYASRLHLYERNAATALKSLAWVRLRVRRQEFAGGAAIAGCFVAGTMWAAWLTAKQAALTPTSVPTLLLLVPSVIGAYAVRQGPHRLTVKMLRSARWLVAASALVPFVGAAMLALAARDTNGHAKDRFFESWWLIGALVATVIALVLIGSVIFPIPQVKTQALRRRLSLNGGRPQDDELDPESWAAHWQKAWEGPRRQLTAAETDSARSGTDRA
jgi:hypothetical protein